MSDFATKYAMKKRMGKDSGSCADCAAGSCMAHGGAVKDAGSGFSDDMVSRIMKHRYSRGGQVANDSDPIVDAMPAEYDELVKDDDLEFHETGANSGDELGNEKEDEDDEDVVSKVMKSRKKKDRMPRPA